MRGHDKEGRQQTRESGLGGGTELRVVGESSSVPACSGGGGAVVMEAACGGAVGVGRGAKEQQQRRSNGACAWGKSAGVQRVPRG